MKKGVMTSQPQTKEKKHLGSVGFGRTNAVDIHPASKDIDSSEDARAIDLLEHGLVSGLQTGTLLLPTSFQKEVRLRQIWL